MRRAISGITQAFLKSAIQKYARRAEVNKGLWCLVEMDLFSLLEWDGPHIGLRICENTQRNRERIRRGGPRAYESNMINRLVRNDV